MCNILVTDLAVTATDPFFLLLFFFWMKQIPPDFNVFDGSCMKIKAALAASLPTQLYRHSSQFSYRFWILFSLRLEIGTTGANLSAKAF